jgi:hypothetical protein
VEQVKCELEDPCAGCRAGFHNECDNFWSDAEDCGCGGEVKFHADGSVKATAAVEAGEMGDTDTGYISDGYEAQKDISEYKDPVSTGRKRAAQMYPITPGMTCEWAGLKYAGGGVFPIIGCIGRPASDRHHGPDKNTMNNAAGNLHRICDFCHNTWHAVNDPYYGERPDHTQPFLPIDGDYYPHDPATKATQKEILAAEAERLAKQ